jgi:hypothetical protein
MDWDVARGGDRVEAMETILSREVQRGFAKERFGQKKP